MFDITVFVSSMFLAVTLLPYLYVKSPPTLPEVQLDEWWGPENLTVCDDVVPFEIQFDDATITDLRYRLIDSRFVKPLEGIAFQYGFNGDQLQNVLDYWAEQYPFSERENFLNTYPQYKTNIQGLDIHFIRVTPEVPCEVEIVPMLMLHGWPGSVREFFEAIPHLTAVSDDRDYAIELIIPSLPGFGFSSGAVRPGLGADKIAVVLRNLMQRLGYEKYYMQGGDFGGVVTKHMATFFPEEVLGYYTNFPSLMSPLITFTSLVSLLFPTSEQTTSTLSKSYMTVVGESGYLHLQATTPDSIGVALTDSPGALAAYVLEKFLQTEDLNSTDGGLTKHFPISHLLDNLMIYYISNSITTAMRLYAETLNLRHTNLQIDQIPSPVPTIATQAQYDISYTSTDALRRKFPNLINNTLVPSLGHFQALQKPKLFADTVVQAVGQFREWHANNDVTA